MQPVNIQSFFQNFLVSSCFNPTFRCASCGAEISCPFGTSTNLYHKSLFFLMSPATYPLCNRGTGAHTFPPDFRR
ncbi:hypothetical protein Barb6_01947 [Bacteroidales bacterium Barb6]|nr:hypothetical protein Barb6_01947 [Bacteroidales bacterium Barb6]